MSSSDDAGGWVQDLARRELEERENAPPQVPPARGAEGPGLPSPAPQPPTLQALEADLRIHPERSLLDFATPPQTGDKRLEKIAARVEALAAEQRQEATRIADLVEQLKQAERADADAYAAALANGKSEPERTAPAIAAELAAARRRAEALTLARRKLGQQYLDELQQRRPQLLHHARLLVDQRRTKYMHAIQELRQARAALAAERSRELALQAYPGPAVEAPAGTIAGRDLDAETVLAELERDAAWIAAAQQSQVARERAAWADSPQAQQEQRDDRRKARERLAREWGAV